MKEMLKRAMSLVEVVISMLLLGLIVAGMTATFSVVGKAPGPLGSLELQGLNYTRDTIEGLKNAVSTETGAGQHGQPLVDSDPDPDVGTIYQHELPDGDFKDNYGATRGYEVNDIDADGNGTVDYKRVVVTVEWTDD
ncbi:MAG: hypothetical protein HQ547_05450 [Candidatus Omnitrophica bacterium]|nr:hypothetical protein [Candidatus Omnitrophota bacterium]